MINITNKAVELIKYFEGFQPKAYLCPAGYKTIGYGHVLKEDENFDYVSEQEADQLLYSDIINAELAVFRNINVSLFDYQFEALVSFAFNVGSAALQRSTLRMRINALEHQDVPSELMRWVYVGTKKLPGLIRRRKAEAELYTSGNWS